MKSKFEFDNVQLEADFSDFETMQAYEQARFVQKCLSVSYLSVNVSIKLLI